MATDYLLFAMRKSNGVKKGEIIHWRPYENLPDHGVFIKLRISKSQRDAIDFDRRNYLDLELLKTDQPGNEKYYSDEKEKAIKGVKSMNLKKYIIVGPTRLSGLA